MQASKHSSSRDFVYLLHAAVPPSVPKNIAPEPEDEEIDENDEDIEDDGGLKEMNFDD